MILYFSATGNCKYVASRLAKSTEQDMSQVLSETDISMKSQETT